MATNTEAHYLPMLIRLKLKNLLFPMASFLAVSTIVAHAQAPATNILANGSAEAGGDKAIQGWNFAKGNVADENLDYGAASQASEGKQSFHIALSKPVQANVWWAQEVAILPGTKSLQISCRAKRTTDAARTQYAVPAISCYFLDATNTWMGWQSVQDVPESSEWLTLKRNVTVPVGATRVGIRLGVQSQGVVDAYFDDVQVVPSVAAYLDMVANGDLEDSGGSALLGWAFQKKLGSSQQLSFGLSPDAATGKQALRITATDAEVNGYWAQALPVATGIANYQISLRGKLGPSTGNKPADVTAGYAFLDENQRQLAFQVFGLVTDKNWNDYITVASPPQDAKFIEIRLGLDGTSPTEALFDDIKMLPSP